MAPLTADKARELFGDPEEVTERLRIFSDSARVFSSDHPRLIDAYPGQWVAVYRGEVRAHSEDFTDLLKQVDELELSRAQVMVRFIDKNQRALII